MILFLILSLSSIGYANSSNEDLLKASENGNLEQVAFLIENTSVTSVTSSVQSKQQGWHKARADVNTTDEGGYTPLMNASVYGHVDIARLLIEHGALVDVTNGHGHTILFYAYSNGNEDMIELLEENSDSYDNNYDMDLLKASENGDLEQVAFLIESTSVRKARADVNTTDEGGYTPLMNASVYGHIDIARLLIEHGALVDVTNGHGHTILFYAYDNEHTDIIELLEENGVSISIWDAVRLGDAEKVEEAIINGDDINIYDYNGYTPLLYAVIESNIDIVKLLIDTSVTSVHRVTDKQQGWRRANGVNINAKSEQGYTPLMWASGMGNIDIANILVDAGALVNALDDNGYTALMWTSLEGYTDIASLLIENGALVNVQNDYGHTALWHSSYANVIDIIRLLIKNDANIDAQDNEGITPLMIASINGYVDVVELLVESGALIDVKNKDGYTALDLAIEEDHEEIIDILQNSK